MTSQAIHLPDKLVDVFNGPALYRGAYGGRGSAKSRSFAKMAAVHGLRCALAKESGVIVCGREFQNSLDESSMAEVKQAIESEPWLSANYEIGEKYIRTKDGRIDFTFVGLRRNIESVKSTARIRLLWVDEAEPVSEVAWQKAIPTVREEGAEIWVTWNPERRASATNKRFREAPPENSRIVEVNWRDNPWFPTVLDQIRRDDEAKRPDQYGHIWEGDFATAHVGAYYAALLSEAQREGRISQVRRDPLLPLRAYCDLGGTGARSDAFAMWICCFVNREIRVLDYYEAVGQSLGVHVDWMRERGYGHAQVFLPHDGSTHDRVYDVSFESAFTQAGFATEVIPNQGRGAARARIEAARRLFPSIWFNADTTESGRDALGWYHEKKSEDVRDVGLGPEHDWSSHCFHGDTRLLTRSGSCPIKDLPSRGEVLTRCGWATYRNPRITLRDAPLVAVGFTDGYTVRCTADHLFATGSGWLSAERLQPGTLIQSALTPSHGFGQASDTAYTRASGTLRAALTRGIDACTAPFGRLFTALSPRIAISTTGTATSSTTLSTIWSASRPATIMPLSATTTARISHPHHRVHMLVSGLPHGTPALRAARGTANTSRVPSRGSSGGGPQASAPGAASRSTLSFAGALWCRFIAALCARRPRTKRAGSRTVGPLIIANVRHLNETADVWDITVPDIEEFSLSNGAIVHNSADAFGLMCVGYETPRGRPKAVKYPAQMGFV